MKYNISVELPFLPDSCTWLKMKMEFDFIEDGSGNIFIFFFWNDDFGIIYSQNSQFFIYLSV